MTQRRSMHHALALAALCSLASASALAADRSADRYQQERAACLSGRTNQDQATCLREAGAARVESRRGGLTTPNADYMANALQRCNALPVPDRADCKARVVGYGTQSGSVEGGGIYRETVTRSVEAPPPTMGGSGTGSAEGTPAGSHPGVPPQPTMPPPVTPPAAPR